MEGNEYQDLPSQGAPYLAYTLLEYLQLACATVRRLFSRLSCAHRRLKTRKQQWTVELAGRFGP